MLPTGHHAKAISASGVFLAVSCTRHSPRSCVGAHDTPSPYSASMQAHRSRTPLSSTTLLRSCAIDFRLSSDCREASEALSAGLSTGAHLLYTPRTHSPSQKRLHRQKAFLLSRYSREVLSGRRFGTRTPHPAPPSQSAGSHDGDLDLFPPHAGLVRYPRCGVVCANTPRGWDTAQELTCIAKQYN